MQTYGVDAMIYIIIISLPTLLAYLADKTKGSLRACLVGATLFIPCYFAGVRDMSVGTDVLTYGVWTFEAAKNQSFQDFMLDYAGISAMGFNALSWIAAQTSSFVFYLGMIQALTVCPIYLYARHRYPTCSWPAMAAYMLLLFPISLNAMKQMIAASLCALSFDFIERKKPLAFGCFVLCISLFFHQTAVVFLFMYPIVRLILGVGNERRALFGRFQPLAVGFLVLVLFGVAFIFGNALIEFVAPIKESYSYQAQAEGSRLNYSALVMSVGFCVVLLLNYIGDREVATSMVREESVLGIISIIGFLAFQLNIVAISLQRFAYYLIVFVPLFLSSMAINHRKASSSFAIGIALMLLVFYFIQAYVINRGNAIFPYTSIILGVQ